MCLREVYQKVELNVKFWSMLSFVTAFCFQEARPGTQRQLDECQMFAAKAPNPRCSCSEYRRSIAQESTVCRCRVSPTTDQRRLSREQSDCSKATSDPTVNLRNLIRCTTNLVMQKVVSQAYFKVKGCCAPEAKHARLAHPLSRGVCTFSTQIAVLPQSCASPIFQGHRIALPLLCTTHVETFAGATVRVNLGFGTA